jgi:tetratricopeptide (TPR) repeat protein
MEKLIKSKDPISQLESILSFQLGNPQFSLIRTKNWLEIEPTDVEAKILGVESSLAIGKYSDLPELLDLSKNDNSLDSREHLAALNIEQALNKEQFLEARRLMNEAITEKLGCLSIVAVQLLTVEGNLTDAELKFEEILKSTIITDEQSFVKRVGITRNLIKAGAALRRWDDILILAQAEAKNHPWNMESLLLYLVTFVKALEFQNASKDLGLETHSANPFFQKTNVAEELDWLEKTLGSWNEKEIERWLLRGKLANDPNQSNIRSFALVSPRPDDAAVMVAGLSANRQESTAVQVAKKFDSYPITLYELALCQSKSDPEAAMKTLEKCLKIDSNQPLALALKAVIAEKMDRIDVAVTALEEAIKLWPNEFNWRISAARLWNKLGNLSNRIDHLEEAYQLCPGMVPATLELGNSYLQNGNYENCIKVLEPLSRTEPNHYELWETLADAYFHRGDESSALRAAGRASVINPFSVKPYLLSGKINLKNGEIEKALHYAKLALTRNEKDSESNVFLAKVYLKQGEKQKALSALEKASQCKNATVQTMIDHVELIKEINGTRNTRELITTISEKYPENVDVLKMLAKAQEECGDSTAAEQTAKRALLVNPEQPEMHLFLGEIQTKSGQLDQAIQHFSEAIAQNNGQMDGYLMLSKVYEQQREFTKAIETLNQAIDVNPGDTRSYINAANLFRNSKNYLAAEKMLKKAVEIDPKDLSIRRQLGALLALNLVHQSQEVSSQL